MVGFCFSFCILFLSCISYHVIMCGAFLRTPPHFGLWLKTFDVRPQVIEGEQAECGGATVSKLASAVWLKGSFAKSSDLWQQGWFYIAEPRLQVGSGACLSIQPPNSACIVD